MFFFTGQMSIGALFRQKQAQNVNGNEREQLKCLSQKLEREMKFIYQCISESAPFNSPPGRTLIAL
jgi:hypothetical protein